VLKAVAIWLAAINVVTYAMYAWDKRRAAKGQRRISEKELLMWALAGGSPAALLAMRRLRHKTRKTLFRVQYWVIVAVQVGLMVWLLKR